MTATVESEQDGGIPRRANRAKQRLLACGLNDHYRQIFELTRLDEAISIYGDEAEALAAVSG